MIACPECGAADAFQELGERVTWQPIRLIRDDGGALVEDDYSSFDYGDDVKVTGYQCTGCEHEWPTLRALDDAIQVKALREMLSEVRPYVLNVSTSTEPWRAEIASEILSRVDSLLAKTEQPA